MIDHEYEWESVPGLPERLPDGECILWQGAPRWGALARRAFHVRKVALWFGLILAWVVVDHALAGAPPAEWIAGAGWLVLLGGAAVGVLAVLARAMARSTIYTVTNRRVVMRFGVAIPMTINIPFKQIGAAALKEYADGTGDLPLTLAERARHTWCSGPTCGRGASFPPSPCCGRCPRPRGWPVSWPRPSPRRPLPPTTPTVLLP